MAFSTQKQRVVLEDGVQIDLRAARVCRDVSSYIQGLESFSRGFQGARDEG